MSIFEWILFGLIALPIVLFAAAEIMHSKKCRVAGIVIVSLYVAVPIYEYCRYISFANFETTVQKDTLRIVNSGTGSLGSDAFYDMDGTDVLEETGAVGKRYGFTWIKFGWTFRAKKPGTSIIVVVQREGAGLGQVDAYRVTADDALRVSYEKKSVELLRTVYYTAERYGRLKSACLTDGESGESREIDPETMREFLYRFFGENQFCEEVEVSAMDRLVLNYQSRDPASDPEEYEIKLYIDEDGHYFYKSKRREEDEWVETWNEFTPDMWYESSRFPTESDMGLR